MYLSAFNTTADTGVTVTMPIREHLTYIILAAALVWATCAGSLTAIASINSYLEQTACLRTAELDKLTPHCN